jgi:hypothetical protein
VEFAAVSKICSGSFKNGGGKNFKKTTANEVEKIFKWMNLRRFQSCAKC